VKPRHAAALALVGWYLMVAPRDPDYLFMTSAPLTKWAITKSFDTAEECEKERTEEVHQADRSGTYWYFDTKKRENVGSPAKYAYLCVATNDPRLKSKVANGRSMTPVNH
jgi:hypothetical protein